MFGYETDSLEIRSYLRKRGCSQKMTAKDPSDETVAEGKLGGHAIPGPGVSVEVV